MDLEQAIQHCVTRLALDTTLAAAGGRGSRRKWTGPWWQMAALCELGMPERIPPTASESALRLLKHSTWPQFVISDSDRPQTDEDKAKMDCCHCELAVFFMVLSACGCNVDAEVPWIRPWLLAHQLPDGGLNCSPQAYRGSLKSSIVSTLPPLEAVLRFTPRPFTPAEATFLDDGARYLIEHRLCRVKGGDHIIEPAWSKPIFPRFFEYDVLRGMRFLVDWAERRSKPLPLDVLREGAALLGDHVQSGGVVIGAEIFGPRGRWPSETFPLLELVGSVGTRSTQLTLDYAAVREACGRGAPT